ncbi:MULTISPECIES: Pycsar system effector family protein [Pseudoalteromonas]|jgi:hypothetical protein|uniref:Pycsar system effector family protein n=1 Tax=Pseudoalteromonas TaxID=53246 RepID=UPI000781C7AE|nr:MULTISPECIES: Pycsar system effector family protein [Pseudoalteromonas]QLJ09313.1 hypothetical protein GZH31_05555 [Pseudoalteromonas sp. JSTW]
MSTKCKPSNENQSGGNPSDGKPNKSDLWDIIKRYDSYIATINFKSGLITTFNFGVFAGLLVKASELLPDSGFYLWAISLNLVLIALCSMLSIFFVMNSIKPKLDSSNKPSSVIFFGSVADSDRVDYIDKFKSTDADAFLEDISGQVHEVAVITKSKFNSLGRATKTTKANLYLLSILFILIVSDTLGITLCQS